MNTADTYYLKAIDAYNRNLEDTLEALSYGLAHDNEHPALLCMMGKICTYELKQYQKAEEFFEAALSADLNYTETYEEYIRMLVLIGQYLKAEKLGEQALKIPGTDKFTIYYWQLIMLEKQGKYKDAVKMIATCRKHACNRFTNDYLDGEETRIKKKEEAEKKTNKEKKKKKIK